MAGLMIQFGAPKKGAKPGLSKGGSPERDYAKEAFAALKDDDEEGFIEAFLGAIRCSSKEPDADDAGEPDEDD